MSAPPPPYPGNEKAGFDPPQAGYPPPGQPGGYPPPGQPGGYPPPGQPGGYPPPAGGYPPPGQPGGYPPPGQPGGYPPPANRPQNTTVVVSQPVAVVHQFHAIPVRTCCPHCRADVMTATHFESGTFSWLMCVILCLVGCDLGCCLIPFCMEGCQDVIHTCPNCHQHIARWSRL